ncbi:MAG: YCF48-related protein [Thermodesulfobacteriota bacterium]|nr:YCF48-related protein [Thermodesulfobacteriota bacterium]
MKPINERRICSLHRSPRLIFAFTITSLFFHILTLKTGFAGAVSYSLERRDKLFAVHCVDKQTRWIVGNRGLIINSVDGGKTWKKLKTTWDYSLNDITFVNNSGWIVGQKGLILYTNDGGLNWDRQDAKTDKSLLGVYFFDEHNGLSFGESGTILLTKDGGSSWQITPIAWAEILPIYLGTIPPTLYEVSFVDGLHGWIVGDNGSVLSTSDSGNTWESLRIGLFPPLFSVCFKSRLEGWAVGQNGDFLHTQDGGVNWDEIDLPIDNNLSKIHLVGSNGIVVGDRATVILSNDGGKTWQVRKLNMRLPLPWFADAWLFSEDSSTQATLVGKSAIRDFDIK